MRSSPSGPSTLLTIDRARILRGWTRRDLGRQASVDEGTQCDLFAGRRRPTFGTLRAICLALDLALDDIFSFAEPRAQSLERVSRGPSRHTHRQMSWHKTWSLSRRIIGGLSAGLLTAAVALYAPIGLATQSPTEMTVRTHLFLAVLVVSAAGTWIVAITPHASIPRLVSSLAAGFNGIWIFSFIGLPVVVASLIAIFVSAVGVPRRLAAAVVTLAIVGFGLGLVVLRLTEPPGEHIFG